MATALKVVVFFGSVREGRLGFRVAKYVVKMLNERKFQVTLFDPEKMQFPLLKKGMTMYTDPSEAPKWMQDAAKTIQEADGYMVVSAEYNHSIPPALSNMMDHFTIPSYRHKPCSIVTYSYGQYGGVRAGVQLRSFLGELGMVTPHFIFAVPSVHEAFTEDGEPLRKEMITGTERSIKELEWYAAALHNHRKEHGVPT